MTKKNSTHKIFISIVMLIFLMASFIPVSAVSEKTISVSVNSKDVVYINETDYNNSVFISEKEASEIAHLFIQDALSFGDVEWDENTYIKKITKMYSSDNEKDISAYCIELNSGYIVISAYYDASSLIPEWSDQAPPLYSSFSALKQGEVLYLGLYNYYLDTGKKYVENLDGQHISRNDLKKENKIERATKYIPKSILNEMVSNEDNSLSTSSSTIIDPFVHADNNYAGPFICSDYVNEWEPYMSFYTTSYGLSAGYRNHCGPTAITNLILAYGNKHPEYILYTSEDSVFTTVADLGIANGFFSNSSGTWNGTSYYYISDSLDCYNLSFGLSYGDIDYSNLYSNLSNNALMYVMLRQHETYGDHAVVCYAYTRLISTSSGWYKTYMKVADGWYNSGRYIDLQTALTGSYVSVNY